MKPSDLTPYVWNLLIQTFTFPDDSNTPLSYVDRRLKATAWLSTATPSIVFSRILHYEGIYGYDTFILTLVHDLKLG